ncbi:hypothetical protein LX32DRAFT_634578 [Colletotrichum zoysiae]|uniref:Clr5 domain-containing protein n=1 Tax=Colletotrichum zoysiae TaxID=1216348 RepID=A0AAD9HRY1_9PEZI|nr:hypothetical protein LX32DRAFT_634578 [Colletotrichum zoysiae]
MASLSTGGMHMPPAGEPDVVSPLGRSHRAREYLESEWDQMQPFIQRLYIEDKRSLKEVVRLLSEKHCFHVNEKMCKGRLKKWKFHKYNTEERVRDFLGQERDGSARRSQAKSRKIDKYLRRKGMTADALLASHRKTPDEQKQAHLDDSADPRLDDRIAETEQTPSLAPIFGDSFHNEQYGVDCPYQGNGKWFRLQEELSDGAQYQGDSFGDRSWINQYADKRCTSQCLCRRHEVTSAAAFLVEKTHESMRITFYTKPLLSLVLGTLQELGFSLGTSSSVDGILLLQHQAALKDRLSELHGLRVSRGQLVEHNTLLRELELLVGGVLCNGEIFKSFGYEKLKERGIIDDAVLETFSRQSLDASVDGLDEAFQSNDTVSRHGDLRHENILWFSDVQQRLYDEWISEKKKPILWLKRAESPLTTATVERDAITTRRLLESGSSPDDLLLGAAATNDTSTLSFLLEQGADADDSLLTASSFGLQHVVEVLLAHGVDVNCITQCGSPLSVAAKSRHRSLAMYLVQCGADVHTAIKCLHLGGLKTDDHSGPEDLLRKLPKAVSATKRNFAQSTTKLSEGMIYLRKRLAFHHRIMKQSASLSSSAFREVGHGLSGYRSLWSLGIKTLKLLINGRAPRSLAEAIAFLCISQAMIDVLKARHHRDFLQEFIQDLPRWQVIFEETDLTAYREAVWLIWNIDVDSHGFQTLEGRPFPAEHLPHGNPGGFEKLSWILANSIDECFGTLPSESLLGSQRLWMQQEESLGFQGHPPEITNPPPQVNIMTGPQPQWDPPPLDPRGIYQDQPPISEDEGARNRRIVECLMTAVAFALVVLFAEILQKLLRTECCTRVVLPSLATTESRRRLLRDCSGLTGRSRGVVRVMGIFGNKESFV